MTVKLLIQETQDPIARENMLRLQEELSQTQVLLKGNWRFLTLTFTAAVTNFRYLHKLGFVPHDVIQTSLIGAGALTWNYSLFSSTELDITTTDACVVRAFIGSYLEGRS